MSICTDEVVVGKIMHRKKDAWQEVLCWFGDGCSCDSDYGCSCDSDKCGCDDHCNCEDRCPCDADCERCSCDS